MVLVGGEALDIPHVTVGQKGERVKPHSVSEVTFRHVVFRSDVVVFVCGDGFSLSIFKLSAFGFKSLLSSSHKR